MKRHILSFVILVFISVATFAQSAYQFTNISNKKAYEVENQCATGTCWSYATSSFIEAEMARLGAPLVDISEMANVRYIYPLKAASFVRFQGKQQFGPGGLSQDVITAIREFGLVPESAYTGLKKGETFHDHGAMDAFLEGTVNTVLKSKMNENNMDWMTAVNGILDAYLGPLPTEFDFNGKKYTPISFRDEMKINPDNYVNLTSFTHHPYYSPFVLEVPDNWAKGSFYNLPLDEFQKVIDYALDNGFTIAWDADVSEKGFSFKYGMAIVPEDNVSKDQLFTAVVKEKEITPELRQQAYESFDTTDDHLMHITGKAKDQNGNIYYIIKNSWGTNNPYGGYQYVSLAYLKYKTVSLVLHKDGIPSDVKKKLGL